MLLKIEDFVTVLAQIEQGESDFNIILKRNSLQQSTDFANSQNNEFSSKNWRVRFGGTTESSAFINEPHNPGTGRAGFEGFITDTYVFQGVLTENEIKDIESGQGLPSTTEHPVLFNGNNATIQDDGLSTFTVWINPYQYAAPYYNESNSDLVNGNTNPFDSSS